MHIVEKIEFLTQLHKSYDLTEQRAALRVRPRRAVSYDYTGMNSKQSQYLRALAYSQQTQVLKFPMWHVAGALTQKIYLGDPLVYIDKNRLWGYRGAYDVMLWRGDEYGGTVYPINNLANDGSIMLGKQVSSNWDAISTTVCPLIHGVLTNEDSYQNQTSHYTDMALNVELIGEANGAELPLGYTEDKDEVDNTDTFYGANFGKTYNNAELWLQRPNWADEMGGKFTRNAYRLDNKSGYFAYDLRGNEPTETKDINLLMTSREQINNLQRFFCRCKGRLKSFYAPTWLQDFDLHDNAMSGSNFLLVKFPLYWKYFSNIQRRKKIVVFFKDGTAKIINVAAYSTDETGEIGKVWLDSTLRTDIMKNNVQLISFLCRYRFDDDLLTIDYKTPSVAEMTQTLAEVTA